jgi:hypothetical protein
MNHSNKPKEYDRGIFAKLIELGRIKLIGTRKKSFEKLNPYWCPNCGEISAFDGDCFGCFIEFDIRVARVKNE